jgi:aldehyde dehydrogenase (NAD+)
MSQARDVLPRLGIDPEGLNPGVFDGAFRPGRGKPLESLCPADGSVLGRVARANRADYDAVVAAGLEAWARWRLEPAPRRGEVVRLIAEELRRHRRDLGTLVSLENGKILAEGLGEVQEMIDMADFAVGLSRQLHGLVMQSERPGHRMFEQWHPLGTVGVITAFNFPVAVWAWNAFLAGVCGDVVLWKPASPTPLCALAVSRLVDRVLIGTGWQGVFNCVIGSGAEVGDPMLDDPRVPLVSLTGSTEVGRKAAGRVASRFGRTILELGGNNGVIVLDDADLDLALRAVLFGAVGTAGQRCTSTRRLFLQKGIAAKFVDRLVATYGRIRIGDPLDPATLCGPLVDADAVKTYAEAVERIRKEGGEVLCGGKVLDRPGFYVEPTIVRAPLGFPMSFVETFAPILYVFEVKDLDEAIARNNEVPQGLSSSIFTDGVRSAERFLGPAGSDCGIANVNIGTSGAEIGGAFGGEKETGGGREAGTDSWKQYMRRQTSTVNGSADLPLAQGVKFDV